MSDEKEFYKINLSLKDELWKAEYEAEDGVRCVHNGDSPHDCIHEVMTDIDEEKPVDVEVILTEHPLLKEVNERHELTPFRISGYNFDKEIMGKITWENFIIDYGWSSRGFGFDSGFTLEEAIKNCHEYAMEMEPKCEHFTLSLRLNSHIEENVLPVILKKIPKDLHDLIKEIFFKGYEKGFEDRWEHYQALTDPDYDWDKWAEKEKPQRPEKGTKTKLKDRLFLDEQFNLYYAEHLLNNFYIFYNEYETRGFNKNKLDSIVKFFGLYEVK